MNVLASFMQDHPEVVDVLATSGERMQFGSLRQLLSALGFPFALTSPEIDDALAADPELEGPLQEAYLPVVPLEHWQEAVEQAQPIHPISEPDWVIYAAAKELPAGVTLPQDGDPILRVSLFTRIEERIGRVSVDYANGAGSPPTGLSTAVNECSLPDWGRCEEDGACQGECQPSRAFGPERMVCRCTLS
jgi:hypothetical protein